MHPAVLIGIGIAVVVAILIGVIALQPPTFEVVRSTTIAAAPGQVFPHVNDFHNWDAWSPWAKLDSSMKQTFEGPAAGTGAVYTWSGNNKVGEGRMAIIDSRPGERVQIDLQFIRPFASTADTLFTFQPQGDGTVVTWKMSGKKNFMSKAFGLVMSMDKMIGGDFDKGLASMKVAAESAA